MIAPVEPLHAIQALQRTGVAELGVVRRLGMVTL